MAKPELGAKRQCQSCAAKFFDLNRTPIVCPKCGTIFQAVAVRAPARAAAVADEDEAESPQAELVPLEDADAAAEKVVEGVDDDLEIEDDAADADDTFLEEEEEDADDVSGLIDGDIESDEEA